MELNDFIQKFADLFDDTDLNEFSGTTVYKNLDEWSSLLGLSVIAMVDEEYDVKINGDDVRNTSTINALFELVKSRI